MKMVFVPIVCNRKVYKVFELDLKKVFFMKRRKTPQIPKHTETSAKNTQTV